MWSLQNIPSGTNSGSLCLEYVYIFNSGISGIHLRSIMFYPRRLVWRSAWNLVFGIDPDIFCGMHFGRHLLWQLWWHIFCTLFTFWHGFWYLISPVFWHAFWRSIFPVFSLACILAFYVAHFQSFYSVFWRKLCVWILRGPAKSLPPFTYLHSIIYVKYNIYKWIFARGQLWWNVEVFDLADGWQTNG